MVIDMAGVSAAGRPSIRSLACLSVLVLAAAGAARSRGAKRRNARKEERKDGGARQSVGYTGPPIDRQEYVPNA